jgi:hypothetical protein
MSNLKLFKVNVTQEWSAESEAFVWATSQHEAEEVAYKNIDVDLYDADDGDKCARSTESTFLTLDKLGNNVDFYFFAPSINGHYNKVGYETFKSYISEEDLERIRIEKIEKDNGQLSLLLKQ